MEYFFINFNATYKILNVTLQSAKFLDRNFCEKLENKVNLMKFKNRHPILKSILLYNWIMIDETVPINLNKVLVLLHTESGRYIFCAAPGTN